MLLSRMKQISLNGLTQRLLNKNLKGNKYRLSVCRSFSEVHQPTKSETVNKSKGILDKFFDFDSNTASKDFNNRWLMVVPAFVAHMCIGAPYAWSLMADIITREYGFIAPAAADWTMMESAFPLSLVFASFGVSASLLGKWQMKVGARKSMAIGSLTFGGGMMLGAAGIYLHSLPLMYFGYGILGGLGIGFVYTPPVQTLMQWFPDKKGVASGLCIAGFGSGALLFSPMAQHLMKSFVKLPEYLGPASEFVTKTMEGKLFADVNGKLVEVVNASATDIAKVPYDLLEGLYVVGSGSTGASEALAVMGAGYFAAMLASALAIYKPHPTTVVAPVGTTALTAPVPVTDVDVDAAFKTPQFHLLGLTFFCTAAGGIGLFSVAKPMMSEVFSTLLPALVTSAFASKFILMLSAGNLGGRLGWAAISDVLGRKTTFAAFTAGSVPLYLAMPSLVDNVVATGSSLPLYGFCASTVILVSVMGGVYAILPAYEADLYGTKSVGAIHGRMLLYSSAAAISGPILLIKLRSLSEKNVITDMLSKINADTFQSTFGAPIEQASELFAAKTISISKLLALMPPGTADPTPHIYDTTMYALSGLMTVAFLSHALVKPLQAKAMTTIDVKSKDHISSSSSSELKQLNDNK